MNVAGSLLLYNGLGLQYRILFRMLTPISVSIEGMKPISMYCSPPIKSHIEVGFPCGTRQELWIESFSVDFGNSFRNPAFTLGAEPLALGLNGIFITRLNALIHILILRNAVLRSGRSCAQ